MIYIACEHANFVWRPSQIREFDRLWREGYRDMIQLARFFKRPVHDVAFLIWDRNHNDFQPVRYIDGPKRRREPRDPNAPKQKPRGRHVKKLLEEKK